MGDLERSIRKAWTVVAVGGLEWPNKEAWTTAGVRKCSREAAGARVRRGWQRNDDGMGLRRVRRPNRKASMVEEGKRTPSGDLLFHSELTRDALGGF